MFVLSSVDEEVSIESCVFLFGCTVVLVCVLRCVCANLLSSSTLFLVLSACSKVSWFLTLLSICVPSSFV
jgi:hypothetical protein